MIKSYPRLLLVIVITHFSIFSILGISRHWGYMTSINDLGCFDQAVWGIIHQSFPINSSVFSSEINWFGFHFHPILYLFVPFYYLFPTAHWFTIAQSAALSLAALPIFSLARQVTQSEKQAILWSAVYLLNPFVLNADAWDFHPVSLAVSFIALAFLSIEQQKVWLFSLANISLLLCQEQFGLTVACFGLLYGIKNKKTQLGSLFFVLGISSVFFILALAMPYLSPTKQHIMLEAQSDPSLAHLNRYGWLGHNLNEVVKSLVFSPKMVLKTILLKFQGWFYLDMLLLPFLLTPLTAPLFMLPMLPDLLANMLAANHLPRSIASYHSATIIPALVVSAIYGSQRLAYYCSLFHALRVTQIIFVFSCFLAYRFAPLPLPFANNPWHPVKLFAPYDPREEEVKALIGQQSVSAQVNVGSHFSQRAEIYRFPYKIKDSLYIVVWLNTPTFNYEDYLGVHIQMPALKYLSKIESLLISKNFKIIYWNDPWLVFKKELKTQPDNRETQVHKKISYLKSNLFNNQH